MSSPRTAKSTWGSNNEGVLRASASLPHPRSSASSIASVEPASVATSLKDIARKMRFSTIAPVSHQDPGLHEFGWNEYHPSDNAVYYVHPIRRVTADIDLRDKGNLKFINEYLESRTEATDATPGTELWLIQDGEPNGIFASRLPLVRLLVDHRHRIVVVDRSASDGSASLKPDKTVVEDNFLSEIDIESRYWSFVEAHYTHTMLPQRVKREAMDVLTWIWIVLVILYYHWQLRGANKLSILKGIWLKFVVEESTAHPFRAGWIRYDLPDYTVYYVLPTRRMVVDIDLRDKGNFEFISEYLESHADTTDAPPGSELWLIQDGEPNDRSASRLPLRLLVNHRQRTVVVDWSASDDRASLKTDKTVVEDNFLSEVDIESRYWSFVEAHYAHTTLPQNVRTEAMDVLTWIWIDWILPSNHSIPAPFSREECEELMQILRSTRHTILPAAWRQQVIHPKKHLAEEKELPAHFRAGWITYDLPDCTVYHVHPTHRMVVDIDLWDKGNLEFISEYLKSHADTKVAPPGSELWLIQDSEPNDRSASRLPLTPLLVNHRQCTVVVDWSASDGRASLKPDKTAVEDYFLSEVDIESRYWSFVEAHYAHIALPQEVRAEAMDVLSGIWTAPFSREDCEELLQILRLIDESRRDVMMTMGNKIVARIYLRIAAWRQKYVRGEKLLTEAEDLITRLTHIFATKEDYRRLLSCRGTSAQKLLNMFQQLLDLMDNQPTQIHRNLIAAAQRLAGASGLYPTCYELDSMTDTGVYQCSGGFADVYKADIQGQAVCLKTVRLNSRTDPGHFLKARLLLLPLRINLDVFQVFSKEAILWGQLHHPNILPFYGIFRLNGRLSFVAPWMENGDVSKYLMHNNSSNRVLLSLDVAQGLQFLHENDIVHGDLKAVGAESPVIQEYILSSLQANILVNGFGRACLADLGLSSISDKEILAWTSNSSVGSKGGTVRWQAPELLHPEGDEEIHNTKASDIYAWASVTYEIFTGEMPYAHITRDATIIYKVLSGERPQRPPDASPSWSVWGLKESIWKLMETCWDSDPAQRPNASVIIESIQATLPKDLRDAHAEINSGSLSPGQFRKMACRDADLSVRELSVKMLESILANEQS
ncbi:hypothetical protein H0H92_001884 [Tricholoma furcatifolium]|nr:hypothetical protein H0H92_001884 [Tricholoma furcatifolium]